MEEQMAAASYESNTAAEAGKFVTPPQKTRKASEVAAGATSGAGSRA